MKTTKTRKVMAVKPHKYGTRMLTAGEEYELPVRQALAIVASKKARFLGDPKGRGDITPRQATPQSTPPDAEPPAEIAKPDADPKDIDRLRGEATQLGILVDGRWGVARLQHEIASRTSRR